MSAAAAGGDGDGDDGLILHHYDISPFAEKIRLVLGLKGLAWASVIQPMVAPKPLLTPLTGGFRRTPVLQIGADIHCDTAAIAVELDRRAPTPAVLPPAEAGAIQLHATWAERVLMWPSARYVIGNYTSHHGSEGYQQAKEIDFAIRVAEEVQIPVHLFHFKMRGRDNWGTIDESIAQIEEARARGLDITANQYPYTAMFHGWSAFFPRWMREGGPERFAERLRDESLRERIKSDPDFVAWAQEHGWWEGIVLARANTPKKQYEGMRVAEIARLRGDADPADAVLSLMAEEGGSISGIFHTMSEEDVRLAMKQPWVAHASDGSAINLDASGVPHPRNYSTFPRVLGHYVRDEGVLTLEDAVRKMTSLPAQILGLRDRGQLREGFAADVVVFDPQNVRETNSFENPKSYPEGIPYVLVNGVAVINEGQHTGVRPGQVIYGKGYKPKTL